MPQGSILGPILFLIYINDIVAEIGSNIRLFADDTSLYIIVENPITSALCLNSDLSKISICANNWLVDFNPIKTESMLISRKLNKPVHPPLFMQEVQIAEVSSHKHLGLILSNDCTWHQHIDYITKKAWNRINIMRKLKFKLDRSSLEIIFTTFIRPLLEYGDIVWDNCTQVEKQEIEKIQIEAARIATGTTKLVSLNALYQETGWVTLEKRRENHKLVMSATRSCSMRFFKMSGKRRLVQLSLFTTCCFNFLISLFCEISFSPHNVDYPIMLIIYTMY